MNLNSFSSALECSILSLTRCESIKVWRWWWRRRHPLEMWEMCQQNSFQHDFRDAFFIRSMIAMQMKMSRIILPISAKIAECNKLRLWHEWLAWEMQWTQNELILSHVWHNLRRFCYVTIIHLILWFTWQKHLNMRVWHSLIHFCACRFYLFFQVELVRA